MNTEIIEKQKEYITKSIKKWSYTPFFYFISLPIIIVKSTCDSDAVVVI